MTVQAIQKEYKSSGAINTVTLGIVVQIFVNNEGLQSVGKTLRIWFITAAAPICTPIFISTWNQLDRDKFLNILVVRRQLSGEKSFSSFAESIKVNFDADFARFGFQTKVRRMVVILKASL